MSLTITKAKSASRMRSRLAACAVLLAGIAGGAQASAFLEGSDFFWWETSDHPFAKWNTFGGLVGAGIDHDGIYYTVDISDTGLSLQFLMDWSFQELNPRANGFNLNMMPFWAPTSVAVVSSPWTGFGDHDQHRLTFDPAILHIDFGGLTVHPDDTLVLSLKPVGTVPEPATAALLAAGLGLLFWRTQARRGRANEQL